MKTQKEVAQEFKAELQKLLFKYDADIIAKDHSTGGYSQHGDDIRMTVSILSVWDSQNELLIEGTEIDLGNFVDKNFFLE